MNAQGYNGKTVFLTGASGMLGSHITRELLLRGYKVKAFIELGAPSPTIDGLAGLTKCYGSILNGGVVLRESKGCDYIIHTAASTNIYPSKCNTVRSINIDGTANIITAAISNRVTRLIHLGSANSFGYGTLDNPGNENTPYCCNLFGVDYLDSKRKAHEMVLSAVKNNHLDAVIICPTFMLGRYDSKPGSGALVASVYHQSLPGYTTGGKNYVYTADVAVAVCNAIISGRKGEAYITGCENLNYHDAFELIANTIGVKAPSIPIPKYLATLYGGCNEAMCKVTGKKPKVTYSVARIGNAGFYYSSQKAIDELNLPQTPIKIAIKDCFEWLKENNLLGRA